MGNLTAKTYNFFPLLSNDRGLSAHKMAEVLSLSENLKYNKRVSNRRSTSRFTTIPLKKKCSFNFYMKSFIVNVIVVIITFSINRYQIITIIFFSRKDRSLYSGQKWVLGQTIAFFFSFEVWKNSTKSSHQVPTSLTVHAIKFNLSKTKTSFLTSDFDSTYSSKYMIPELLNTG